MKRTRRYENTRPATNWADNKTDALGRFIQKDAGILNNGDRAVLEFIAGGQPYYSDPSTASLPFKNIQLTGADYFNDTVTGHIDPVHLINWDWKTGDPEESKYEWVYYSGGLAFVEPIYLAVFSGDGKVSGGTATCLTNAYGDFDTRKAIAIKQPFDVRPADYGNMCYEDFIVTLDSNSATLGKEISFSPTMSLVTNESVSPVPGSYKRTEQDGKIIDEMKFDEYIFIVNPNGTRTVTQDECKYAIWGFSTADSIYRYDDRVLCETIAAITGNDKWTASPIGQPVPGTEKITPVLDSNGNPTGAAMLSQRVTVQWVWQKHPGPVKIVSADNTAVTKAGGSFQVTATGIQPFFAFSLKNAPAGVVIDKASGLMTLPPNLAEQKYTFTIHAEEDRSLAEDHRPSHNGSGRSVRGERPLTAGRADLHTDSQRRGAGPVAEPVRFSVGIAVPVAVGSSAHAARHRRPERQLSVFRDGARKRAVRPRHRQRQYAHCLVHRPDRRRTAPVADFHRSQKRHFNRAARHRPGHVCLYDQSTQQRRFGHPGLPPRRQPRRAPRPSLRRTKTTTRTRKIFKLTKLTGAGDLTVPFTTSGSTPVAWSLEKTNPRSEIPAQVTIDAKTGVLNRQERYRQGHLLFHSQGDQ